MGKGPSAPAPDPALAQQQAEANRIAAERLAYERAEAERQAAIEAQRYADEQAARVKAEQEAAAEKERLRNEFTTKRAGAKTTAQTDAQRYVTERGLNYDEYADDINRRIDAVDAGMPDLAPDPYSAYSSNLAADILEGIQSGRRTNYSNTVANTFSPTYAQDAFLDTDDDAYIDTILGEQRKGAMDYVDNTKKRGLLNDTGYQRAVDVIANQEKAGRSALQGTGGTILEGYRGKVNDVVSDARNAASGYSLGQTFNVDPYTTRAQSVRNSSLGSLESDLRRATNGTNYFDMQEAVNLGGTTQGPQNDTRSNAALLDAIAKRQQQQNSSRGLDTQGVF